MGKLRYLFLMQIFTLLLSPLNAQDTIIMLKNAGFEEAPKQGGQTLEIIQDWSDCGKIKFPDESPPDIHPNGYWENHLSAHQGKTYLGIVVRDNGSYEGVGQKCSSYLLKGHKYEMSVYLAQSPNYKSASRSFRVMVNFTTPTVIRIWGSSNDCQEEELLYESPPIDHKEWKEYKFWFRPKSNLNTLKFSAYYKINTIVAYNGHILLDAISDIRLVD
jgi:hypothetical protein